MIYLDNAATSWPKPPAVMTAMQDYLERVGGSPGRSGHRMAVQASRLVYDTRAALAELFGAGDPLRVVFAGNITEALNLALRGLLRPGDHVIAGGMEHNSVMRPLRALQRQGVALTIVPATPAGEMPPADFEAVLRPETRLIVLNGASNVVGTLAPFRQVGEIARRHGVLFLVDAAQLAGAYPLDVAANAIDLLAFTGHKSLLGPQGTGGLVVGERVPLDEFEPLLRGGTGSHSEHEEQPAFLPDRFESGTANAVGIAGLGAAVGWIMDRGVAQIRAHEETLTRRLLERFAETPGVQVYGTSDAGRQTACVAFNVAGISPAEVGLRLDEEYEIMCRVGLHCAPAAHRSIGTFPAGAVRFGLGPFNTLAEVDRAADAVATLARPGT